MADRDIVFRDREEAGRRLARRLEHEDLDHPIVLALPRGGVPVAAPVGQALGADVVPFVARKIGAPGHPEFGIGAVAEGDELVVSDAAAQLGISSDELEALADAERSEIVRRVEAYRQGRPLPRLEGRDVVLVDDGLATGVTAEAALRSVRRQHPRRLLFAAPVCAPDTAKRLEPLADDIVCLSAPEGFGAVGQWYENFAPTTDEEVVALVQGGQQNPSGEAREITVDVGPGATVVGDLAVPADTRGIVVFAHGSGSSRKSPRNQQVAETLQGNGLATLLVDLLTADEAEEDAQSGHLRFDIDLLARRLQASTAAVRDEPDVAELPLGYFGASTGAAAALVAAAEEGDRVGAVVSRGGRPDLAGDAVHRVSAPTLLIVGEGDPQVLELNRQVLKLLPAGAKLEVVPGATHLFEEEGALEQVAELAGDWFRTHLAR